MQNTRSALSTSTNRQLAQVRTSLRGVFLDGALAIKQPTHSGRTSAG